jgi:hypothetical protein
MFIVEVSANNGEGIITIRAWERFYNKQKFDTILSMIVP